MQKCQKENKETEKSLDDGFTTLSRKGSQEKETTFVFFFLLKMTNSYRVAKF